MRRLTFALALGAAALALPALAERQVTHDIRVSTARGNIKRVVIDIPAGEFHVRNGANIAVDGMVRRNYDGDRSRVKSQRVVDDMSAEIVVDGDVATIRRTFGPNAKGWSARNHTNYEVTIEVPKGLDVDAQTRFGELNIDGSFGNFDVDMNAGEIHMTAPRKSVRHLSASVRIGEVHANTGSSTIENEGLFPHTARYTNAESTTDTSVNLHVTFGEVHVTLTQ